MPFVDNCNNKQNVEADPDMHYAEMDQCTPFTHAWNIFVSWLEYENSYGSYHDMSSESLRVLTWDMDAHRWYGLQLI